MHAPINLYYDVTPVDRIQKKFGEDLGAIEHRFWGMSFHLIHLICEIAVLVYLMAGSLPMILLSFIPLAMSLFYMNSQFDPVLKEMRFL